LDHGRDDIRLGLQLVWSFRIEEHFDAITDLVDAIQFGFGPNSVELNLVNTTFAGPGDPRRHLLAVVPLPRLVEFECGPDQRKDG